MPAATADIARSRARRADAAPERASGRLALRELEAAARLGLAVLLALDRAAVASQETRRLDHAAQRRLVAGQRLADAMLDRARLARQAAAGNGGDDVVLAVA